MSNFMNGSRLVLGIARNFVAVPKLVVGLSALAMVSDVVGRSTVSLREATSSTSLGWSVEAASREANVNNWSVGVARRTWSVGWSMKPEGNSEARSNRAVALPSDGATDNDVTGVGLVFQSTVDSCHVLPVVETRIGVASPLTLFSNSDSALMRSPCQGERLKRMYVSPLETGARSGVDVA